MRPQQSAREPRTNSINLTVHQTGRGGVLLSEEHVQLIGGGRNILAASPEDEELHVSPSAVTGAEVSDEAHVWSGSEGVSYYLKFLALVNSCCSVVRNLLNTPAGIDPIVPCSSGLKVLTRGDRGTSLCVLLGQLINQLHSKIHVS